MLKTVRGHCTYVNASVQRLRRGDFSQCVLCVIFWLLYWLILSIAWKLDVFQHNSWLDWNCTNGIAYIAAYSLLYCIRICVFVYVCLAAYPVVWSYVFSCCYARLFRCSYVKSLDRATFTRYNISLENCSGAWMWSIQLFSVRFYVYLIIMRSESMWRHKLENTPVNKLYSFKKKKTQKCLPKLVHITSVFMFFPYTLL